MQSEDNKIYTIENDVIQRNFSLKNFNWSTISILNKLMNKLEPTKNSAEFELIIEIDNSLKCLSTKDFKYSSHNQFKKGKNTYLKVTLQSLSIFNLNIEILYWFEEDSGVLKKEISIQNQSEISLRILDVAVESLKLSSILKRGGLGQPIFGSGHFFALEWPAGENAYDSENIRLWQYPDEILKSKNYFKTEIALIGSSEIGNECKSFKEYIDKTSLRKNNELFLAFSDWSAHDELSGKLPTNEALSTSLIKVLKRMKKYGVIIDYFIVDSIWFHPNREKPYMLWKKKKWATMPLNFFNELKETNLNLGLWIDPTGFKSIGIFYPEIVDDVLEQIYRVDPAGQRLIEKRLLLSLVRKLTKIFGHKDGTIPCMITGDYMEKLENAYSYYAKEHNLGLVKIDFVRFECNNSTHNHRVGRYSKDKSIRKFRNFIKYLREINPKLVALAYNGFAKHQGFIEQPTSTKDDYAISPFWVRWINTIYVGDPRVSEIPTPIERSSIACYTDTQIRLFNNSLLPLRVIDDHSVLIGKTGTIMYLGAKDWRHSWILSSLGRGNLNSYLHGDINLIDNESDFKFLKTTQDILSENTEILANIEFIGGDPELGDVYGTIMKHPDKSDNKQFIVIHNPSFISKKYKLPITFKETFYRLFPFIQEENSDIVELSPSEVALFEINSKKPSYLFEECQIFRSGLRLSIIDEIYIRKANNRIIGGRISLSAELLNQKNPELYIAISFKQSIYPWRFFNNPNKDFKFSVDINGKNLKYSVIPDSFVWSGISWVVYRILLDDFNDEILINFSLIHPWARLVKSKMDAYILSKI